jgi:hypothetical protein
VHTKDAQIGTGRLRVLIRHNGTCIPTLVNELYVGNEKTVTIIFGPVWQIPGILFVAIVWVDVERGLAFY